MRFKIERTERSHATVAVHGWIVEESIRKLNVACDALLAEGRTLDLDLSGVTFADAPGAEVVRGLCRQGAKIVECPQFILEFIGDECRE